MNLPNRRLCDGCWRPRSEPLWSGLSATRTHDISTTSLACGVNSSVPQQSWIASSRRVLGEATPADLVMDGDREWLRENFGARGFDPDTLPVSFDHLTDAFAESLWSELRRESQEPGSPFLQARATRMIEEVLRGQDRHEEQASTVETGVAAIREDVGRLASTFEGGVSQHDTERQLASVPPTVRDALVDRLHEPWVARLFLTLLTRIVLPSRL